jgi:TRAP-type mannitol/chloroaromatic compound transport system substrate-binding protein
MKDLSGLKITLEGSFNDFYQKLGSAGAIVSGTETYLALKLGTVDAAQWDVSAITALKWYEVAPYWIKGGENHQHIGHILVNLKRWNALPEDLKQVMNDAAKAYWSNLIDLYDVELKKADDLVKEGKIKVNELDAECRNAHEKAALEVWEGVAARDPANAQAVKLIKTWNKME